MRARVMLMIVVIVVAGFLPSAQARPMRVVSLDYCADQYVLGLADRAQIAAVSHGAGQDDSFFRDRAQGLRQTRGALEEALALKPDLIVRTWGGGPNAARVYARFGVPVLSLGDVSDFTAARAELLRAADALGQAARGQGLAADLDRRLAALAAAAPRPAPPVLYLTAGGATAGRGVMIDSVLRAAGATNAYDGAGWTVLPLEKLVLRPPARVALGFFDSGLTRASAWTPSLHSGWRATLARAKAIKLPTGAIACSGWFSIAAAEALAHGLEAGS